MKTPRLILPTTLSFKNADIVDFDAYLSHFNWKISSNHMIIDGRKCKNANYQAVSLLIMYAWYLKRNGVYVDFKMPPDNYNGLGSMWHRIGGMGCFNVLENSDENFRFAYDKPLFAIRRKGEDMKQALDTILNYFQQVDLEVLKGQETTIHYLISELIYNSIEHGVNPNIPALLQFNWYREKGQLSFIIADLGIGIKKHLELTYPTFASDAAAIEYAIGPEISGTFNAPKATYQSQNNAGMGLYISSGIGRKLEADMYIVSGNGLLHISPLDITSCTLNNRWPGTFIYMTIGFDKFNSFKIQDEISALREQAKKEIKARNEESEQSELLIDMNNYFSSRCEIKIEATNIRDRKILPALRAGKNIILDFTNTTSATHSFLVALLVTAIKELGIQSYKRIKIIGATPAIRETIDFIFERYT